MKIAVYAHYKPDNTVFYVGKGVEKRAYSKSSRTQYWKNVVAKYGYTVKVLSRWETDEEAFEHEKFLISCFRELGHPLVNLTNGGEGTSGFKWKQESKTKLSNARKGMKFSCSHVESMKTCRLGFKHKPETIKKMQEVRKHGTHNSKPIEVCGKKFQSMTSFAKFVGVTPLCIKNWVDKNKIEKLEKAYESALQKTQNSRVCYSLQ